MRILMLSDWLPPDFGAVGQYALQFARDLADSGHEVTLVGLASGGASEVREVHGQGLLTVKRVVRPSYDKQSFVGRARWTLNTNLALLWHSRSELRQSGEIRFTGSPPYMIHFVMPLAKLFGLRTRYRITDFHPECLMAEYRRVPRWLSALHGITRYWRRRVDVMEVLGEDQRRICLDGGIEPRRLELLRDPSPVHFIGTERQAEPPTVLIGRKIVLYSGNWGVAHDCETFVAGMTGFEARHPGYAGVWLNATGSRIQSVHQALVAAGIHATRSALVPLSELSGVLLAAHVHIICLRDSFVGFVLPSKVYACIASARPILFIGSERSDVHSLCVQAAASGRLAYRRVDVGDAEGVIRGLEELLACSAQAHAHHPRSRLTAIAGMRS
jgi:hypothetical protein